MNTMFLGLRGRDEHTQMLWGDLELKSSPQGEYLEFTERITKTRTGVRDQRAYNPKMFQSPIEGDYLCPIRVYKEYRSHRPVESLTPGSRMYLTPNIKWEQGKHIWYKTTPLGKTPLGELCRKMCERAGIARHTNHSVRRTAISGLLEMGYHETKVQQLTGHKNVQSLNAYRSNSLAQQQQMSSSLSLNLARQALVSVDTNIPTLPEPMSSGKAQITPAPQALHQPPATVTTVTSSTLSLSQTNDIGLSIDDSVLEDMMNDPQMLDVQTSSFPAQPFQAQTFQAQTFQAQPFQAQTFQAQPFQAQPFQAQPTFQNCTFSGNVTINMR